MSQPPSQESGLTEECYGSQAVDSVQPHHWYGWLSPIQLDLLCCYLSACLHCWTMQPEAKMADLQQQQKVSRLQLQTFRASIHLREQRLADTRRRLAAHEG